MAGAPSGGIYAVCVLAERADAGGAIHCPKLDCIIPGGGKKGIATDRIPIGRVNLAAVLLEGADGIGSRR